MMLGLPAREDPASPAAVRLDARIEANGSESRWAWRDEGREPFVTRDGSTVRELCQVGDGAANQSLAEAVVAPGAETIAHLHRRSEEVYRFTSGRGRIRVGDQEAEVGAGTTVLIAPGTPHKLWNTGEEPLVLLCCCSPPYRDDDTEVLESLDGLG